MPGRWSRCGGSTGRGRPHICRRLLINREETSQPFLTCSCDLFPWWAPQAQLRAMLEVSRQQAAQAESQLKELQEQSNQIQVQGLSVLAHSALLLGPSGSHQRVPGTLGRWRELP